jgi:FAD dependent oxidoreductase TIGR03364
VSDQPADYDLIVVGAGVLGTSHTHFAIQRGLRVLLIERTALPEQASVRNFGLGIPIAMASGIWRTRGRRSVEIYRELSTELGFELQQGGTQYLASTDAEVAVLQESAGGGEFLDHDASLRLNPSISAESCRASLHCPSDIRLEPCTVLTKIVERLQQNDRCDYRPSIVATNIEWDSAQPVVITADGGRHCARHVVICNGADLQTLLPDVFAASGLAYCKLQMTRLETTDVPQLPTCLASGLSLRRYPAFQQCASFPRLVAEPIDERLAAPDIHVWIAQDADGRLVVGDSHEVSVHPPDETLDTETESLILGYAQGMMDWPNWTVRDRWAGIYTFHPQREIFSTTIDDRVHVITGIGGKGMTTGPALAEETINNLDF